MQRLCPSKAESVSCLCHCAVPEAVQIWKLLWCDRQMCPPFPPNPGTGPMNPSRSTTTCNALRTDWRFFSLYPTFRGSTPWIRTQSLGKQGPSKDPGPKFEHRLLNSVYSKWDTMTQMIRPICVAFKNLSKPLWSGFLGRRSREGKRILGRRKTGNTALTFTIVFGHLLPPSESHYSSARHNESSTASSRLPPSS